MRVLTRTLLVAGICIAAVGAAFSASAQDKPNAADGLSKSQVESIVRDYLIENPEVVIQAIEAYQARQRVAEQQQRERAMADLRDRIFNDPASPDNGASEYDVTLVEFFDYQCHFCKKVFPDLMAVMETDKRLRVVFKELPILGPESTVAARAALAARKQGKYLEFHFALMDLRGQLTERRIMRTAQEVGIDTVQLARDMQAPEVAEQIQSNLDIAQQVGINGTPAMLIGNQFIPGAIDKATMEQLIAEVRASQG